MARKLTRNGDLVTIHGVFVKLYRNTTEGGVVMTYPFIIGRKLEKAEGMTMRGHWQYSWPMLAFIGAGLSAVFIIFFLAMRRDHKTSEAFLHGRKHKKAGLVSNELARKVASKGKGKKAPEPEKQQEHAGSTESPETSPGPESTS